MKSEAEIMPGTDADSLSHRGADARPWSCSAWNACNQAATTAETRAAPQGHSGRNRSWQ